MKTVSLLVVVAVACAPPVVVDPPAACDEGTPGIEPGSLLVDPPPLSLCDGTEVSLRELVCGERLTLLDVGAASFGVCVEATDRYVTDPDYAQLRADGLQVVQIFTTDEVFQPADAEFCELYSNEHNIDFNFLIDPFAYSDALGAIHPLSFALDGRGIVVERWEGEVPDDQAAQLRVLLDNEE